MRGSSKLPAFTPRRPPQPSSTSAASSNTSTSRPLAGPRRSATAAMASARRCAGGQLARSRDERAGPREHLPAPCPGVEVGGSAVVGDEGERLEPGAAVRGLQDVVAVAGQEHALRGDLARQPWGDPLERRQQEGEASPRAGGASEGAGRVAEPVGVERPGSPMPTTTSGGPSERGSTSACPAFPANPAASRADRSWPTSAGTAPVGGDEHADDVGIGRSGGRHADRDLRHPADPGAGSKSAGTATPPVLLDIVQNLASAPSACARRVAVAPGDRAY